MLLDLFSFSFIRLCVLMCTEDVWRGSNCKLAELNKSELELYFSWMSFLLFIILEFLEFVRLLETSFFLVTLEEINILDSRSHLFVSAFARVKVGCAYDLLLVTNRYFRLRLFLYRL